jgi:hypothetical protein
VTYTVIYILFGKKYRTMLLPSECDGSVASAQAELRKFPELRGAVVTHVIAQH